MLCELFLETASPIQYKLASRTFALDGILTTPASIAATKLMPAALIDDLADCLQPGGKLFVSLLKTEFSAMSSEAVNLANANDDLILQVPVSKDGLQLLQARDQLDLHLCASGCFQAMQAWLAARNGAEYVQFYLNQMDEFTSGLEEIKAFMDMKAASGLQTKVLVASFRNLHQVRDVLALGVDAIALPLPMLMQAISFPQNRLVQAQFQSAWKQAYNRDGFYASMEDDAAREELTRMEQSQEADA